MQFNYSSQKPNIRPLKRPYSWLATLIMAILTVSISSGTAYAGLFSFMGTFFEGTPASAKIISSPMSGNSQTIALLQAATNPDPNPNKIGDIAPIADNTLVPDIASTNNATDTDQTSAVISSYAVREGDTVSGIAKMFKVSVNTVLWANGLTSQSVLRAGETLVILPVSGIMYTVKKGDTVGSIAKKYSADSSDIISYNDLSVSTLAAGQTIIIPDAEIPTPVITKPTHHLSVSYEPLLDNISNWPSYSGYYLRPVSGGRVSQGLHGHNAIDFAAPSGTPIYAAADGTIIINRVNGNWNGGYGNFVAISHDNGTQTLYAHMQSRSAVFAGEYVTRGQVIGYIGMTGLTTGPHVHFEIRGAQNPF